MQASVTHSEPNGFPGLYPVDGIRILPYTGTGPNLQSLMFLLGANLFPVANLWPSVLCLRVP